MAGVTRLAWSDYPCAVKVRACCESGRPISHVCLAINTEAVSVAMVEELVEKPVKQLVR